MRETLKRRTLGGLLLCAGATCLGGERAGSATPAAPAFAIASASPAPSAGALPPAPTPLDLAARAPATEARIAPAKDGHLGAWLLLGPLKSPSYGIDQKPKGTQSLVAPPPGTDEATLKPRLGDAWGATAALNRNAPPEWAIVATNEGAIDVAAAVKDKENDLVAYAAGTLHLEQAGRYLFLFGADDGLRVMVDGKWVFTRDEFRPAREDDDMILLDLSAGDHTVLLKLHQREAAWSFRARVLDAKTLSAPVGSYLALPGTTAADARDLAAKMSSVALDRGMRADGYRPALTVRYAEGAPRGVPLKVRGKLVRAEKTGDKSTPFVPSSDAPFFDVDAGEVPLDASGAGELVVNLPVLGGLGGADLAKIEDGDWLFDVGVGTRSVRPAFHPRRAVREAVARADRVLAAIDRSASWLLPASVDSVEHARARLTKLIQRGDADTESLDADARELDSLVAAIEQKKDPYAGRTGATRRAYRSPADGELSEFGFYAPTPASNLGEPDKKYPLIVALHGMNGRAMAMMRWLFGYDDPGHDQDWEERHMPQQLPRLNAYVVAPDAHGNAMYRTLGEEDVMRVVDWASANFPIDRQRVTITGPSMGGIGTAAIALHHPSRFAAAEPLCGYHSYFIRRDYGGRPVRPWERLIAEERSNTSWAFNGMRIPLFIVHGKKDLPEANSGVLIDRYKNLGYPLKHDHPDLGHNVWSETYQGMKGAGWLLWHKRNEHPKSVRFRTVRLRFNESAWVHVEELATTDAWGEVDARVRGRDAIEVSTKGVGVLRLDRDAELLDAGPVTVTIDGVAITVPAADEIVLRREGAAWKLGAPTHAGAFKHANLTGPIRDAFHEPLLFVYGASDPTQTRANEEVARAWAAIRWGVHVKYPIMSDVEFYARGEKVANDRALFLVGNAASNRVVREIEPELPIKIDGTSVVVGAQKITGNQLGAAFIRPNPKRPDRYIVVVEGVDALGTWRSLSLPELLPDFVVYDEQVAPARGQQLLTAGIARAAGLFTNEWALPADTSDPSATAQRQGAKNANDATSYLP